MADEVREINEDVHRLLNSGELYDCGDADVLAYQRSCVQRLFEYNRTPETGEGIARREEMLREMLGTWSPGVCILPPVHANWGLKNVHVGSGVFINFDAKFVDDGDIFIGADTMIGPGVTIATAVHPESPRLRRRKLQLNRPVHIGENVWIASDATICPGVTIGDDAIIGAGSVVTRDIPAGAVAMGAPARVVRMAADDGGQGSPACGDR